MSELLQQMCFASFQWIFVVFNVGDIVGISVSFSPNGFCVGTAVLDEVNVV